jgi:hypothetical protein
VLKEGGEKKVGVEHHPPLENLRQSQFRRKEDNFDYIYPSGTHLHKKIIPCLSEIQVEVEIEVDILRDGNNFTAQRTISNN